MQAYTRIVLASMNIISYIIILMKLHMQIPQAILLESLAKGSVLGPVYVGVLARNRMLLFPALSL